MGRRRRILRYPAPPDGAVGAPWSVAPRSTAPSTAHAPAPTMGWEYESPARRRAGCRDPRRHRSAPRRARHRRRVRRRVGGVGRSGRPLRDHPVAGGVHRLGRARPRAAPGDAGPRDAGPLQSSVCEGELAARHPRRRCVAWTAVVAARRDYVLFWGPWMSSPNPPGRTRSRGAMRRWSAPDSRSSPHPRRSCGRRTGRGCWPPRSTSTPRSSAATRG